MTDDGDTKWLRRWERRVEGKLEPGERVAYAVSRCISETGSVSVVVSNQSVYVFTESFWTGRLGKTLYSSRLNETKITCEAHGLQGTVRIANGPTVRVKAKRRGLELAAAAQRAIEST